MPRKPSPFLLFCIPAVLATAGVFALLYWGLNWHWLVSYLIGVNLVMWLLYGYDKLCARRDRFRVPEKVLHLFAFVGGTIGALLAMKMFRHKTVKKSFRFAFWSLVVLQVAIVGWFLWQLSQSSR